MHEYYFKIRKGDVEFEFSTSDKFTFEEKLSDWINGIVRGNYIAPPKSNALNDAMPQPTKPLNESSTQRSGFLDVKNLTTIKEIQTPNFDAIETVDETISSDLPLPSQEVDFEKTLEEAVQNPKIEVVEKTDSLSDFETHLTAYNPQNSIDYLIVTAMYIMNIENQERFSIKQLNAKLVPVGALPIDHAKIEAAIEENLIRVIPDLTGTSEVTEYTLTPQGEGYFVE